jgi:FkbM family methyltransferase
VLRHSIGGKLERLGRRLREQRRTAEVWIDVGAHLGETTFDDAARNPKLTVYAFEPNLQLAGQRMGLLPNFVVLPFAVAETDGWAHFHLNSFDQASSLLPINDRALSQWQGREVLSVARTVQVPTIRLDTFLNGIGLSKIDLLKIDAQGADLAVLKSAGERLSGIKKVVLEVSLAPVPLYEGSHNKSECLDYMTRAGFRLVSEESQSEGQEANLTFVAA